MTDPRITQLAENLINNAICLKAGENVLIETTDTPEELSTELIKAVEKAQGNAFVRNSNSRVRRQSIKSATEVQLKLEAELSLAEMKQMRLNGAYEQLERLSKLGDPLEKINRLINWERVTNLFSDIKTT